MDDRYRRGSRDDNRNEPRRDLNRDVRYPYGAGYGYHQAEDFEARDRYDREVDDYERAEREREAAAPAGTPRKRHRFGRWYGSTGRLRGVGSAEGYSGFGGPGWTPGGFGDPGYNTSGFGSPDYGTSRTGAGWNMGEDRSVAATLGSTLDREILPHHDLHWNVPGPYRGKGPKGYTRSDDRIREDISERLMAHGAIDASEIDVAVSSGTARLTGSVPDRQMKWLAEEIAQSVFGVNDVENNLRVE